MYLVNSEEIPVSATTFYQPASLTENSPQNDDNSQTVELSNEARKQVQLLTVKALEQENESLRQRIIQKRMELMYLLQQRPCPSLPRILPSSYKSSEHGDSFRLIGETLNTLFID
uniref:Transcriptional regulator n=1 Tax=Ascaris lumbricoides TaxID=6252 RepID=A0A0M3HK72_ASCLU